MKKVLAGLSLWCCVHIQAVEAQALAITAVNPGSHSFSGPTTISADPNTVYAGGFSPPLIYRIHNTLPSGWSVTVQAPPPSCAGHAVSGWSYQGGTGTISGSGMPLGFVTDANLAGTLSQGIKVLTTHAGSFSPGIGDYVYVMGSFQFTMPDLGPAGSYQTTLTVTLSGQP